MSVPETLLADLPEAIAERVGVVLPDLKNCRAMAGRFDLARLQASGIMAPAVMISRLDGRIDQQLGGPFITFAFDMAAFVVTRDSLGLSRDRAAANIVQALLQLVPNNRWGFEDVGEAEKVRALTLVSTASEKLNVHLAAVSWVQPVALTEVPAAEPLPIDLYVNPHIEGGQA
ncbi:hypothetical protein [Maritimibacter sp. HL-12]|uniref:hypothetical protein n=1 Tax=Maritimibacter sp. HL-12 TaxID=1162418 RepID=UPI000A0F1B45|nr:hypothetical protein [Maritimibacter sp. HL-12]SMH35821.1 hypothetical protein SAMN05661107_0654 [Maritimibacter sp. HL-12]